MKIKLFLLFILVIITASKTYCQYNGKSTIVNEKTVVGIYDSESEYDRTIGSKVFSKLFKNEIVNVEINRHIRKSKIDNFYVSTYVVYIKGNQRTWNLNSNGIGLEIQESGYIWSDPNQIWNSTDYLVSHNYCETKLEGRDAREMIDFLAKSKVEKITFGSDDVTILNSEESKYIYDLVHEIINYTL